MDPATIGVAVTTAVVVVILTSIFIYLYNSGLFWTPEVYLGTPPVRDLIIMYKTGRGPYENVGPIFEELHKLAPRQHMVGFYYDDPAKVAAADLRWAVGSILANGKEKVDVNVQKTLEAAGCRRHYLPCVEQAILTEWYVGTKLAFVFLIKRVYPAFCSYMDGKVVEGDAPCVEIYEGSSQLTLMFPLDHQEAFYLGDIKPKKS